MELFKQVKINIPLLDAIRTIPSYSKFLKDICSRKRKFNKPSKRVFLTKEVSAIIQDTNVTKYKDPGSPTIPCTIGNRSFERALLDLGSGSQLDSLFPI